MFFYYDLIQKKLTRSAAKAIKKAFCLFLVLLMCQEMLFSASGITSGEITKINPDPQTSAMGGSVIAANYSPSAIYTNPASMAQFFQPKLAFSNTQLAEGMSYQFAGFVIPTVNGNLSGAVSLLSYGDIQGYDSSGLPYDITASQDSLFVLNFAFPLRKIIPIERKFGSIGVNLKVLNSALAGYSASAVAFDIGCILGLYNPWGLSGGFVLKNIGKSLNYFKKEGPLPSSIDAGFKYENSKIKNLTGVINFSRSTNDEVLTYSAGASITPIYPLSARIGWQNTTDGINSGLRGGLGLDFSNVSINYSVEPFENFSMIQKIGIDIAFNHIADPNIAYDYYLNSNFEKARDEFLKGNYIESRQMFEEILSLYPNHQPSKDYLVKIAQDLEKVEQKNKIKSSRYLVKARVAMQKNDLLKAMRYYDKVLGIDPGNISALEGKNNIDEMRQKLDREKIRRKNDKKITELWSQAMEAYKKSDFVTSRDRIKELLAVDPDNEEAQKYLDNIDGKLEKISDVQINDIYLKGVAYYNEGKYQDALKYFESVVLASPSRQDAKNYREMCKKKIREQEDKERTKKAVDEDSKIKQNVDKIYNSGVNYYNSGKYNEALEQFNKAQELADEYQLSDYSAGSKTYILKINSTLAENSFREAQNNAQKGDLTAAYEAYEKSLEYNPDFLSAKLEQDKVGELLSKKYYEEGNREATKGNSKKAKEYFQKSIKYNNKNIDAQRALDKLK